MAEAFVLISVVGAVVSGVSLASDLTPDVNRWLELALCAAAVAFAGGVFVLRRHTSARFYSLVALPGATAQLSLGIYLSGDATNPASALYVLVALFSFYFFSRRIAVAHLAFAAGTYALALVPLTTPAVALDRWMFVVVLAAAAGSVIATLRDRLVAQARRDWLTGLPNRRAFQEGLEHHLALARRSGESLVLVVGDLDEFKQVNDHFGHDAGDEALRRAAHALGASVRLGDLVARLGGDEFAVLLVGADERVAQELAGRVLDTLAAASMTMSLGAAVAADHGHDGEALLCAADAALYAAKRTGRSQLALAPGAASATSPR